MKSLFRAVSLLAFLCSLNVFAWDCDRRCSGYRQCVDENNRRLLEHGVLEEDLPDADDRNWSKDMLDVVTDKSLRGSMNGDVHRDLNSNFRIKMYWKSEYCWQEERRERKWCMECEGSRCTNGDEVRIEKCSSSDLQRWVYKGSGRISPMTDTSLCIGRKDSNDFRLMSCSGSDTDLDGFQFSGKFELKHDGKCLSQDHDPKSGEEVKPISCNTARSDHTNYWIVDNASTSGSSGSNGSSGSGNEPHINFKGRDYCNKNGNPKCERCEGDCDDDDDCADGLVCKERDTEESFSGCSGGSTDTSNSDYCVPA